jgi:hypothetical protein
LAQIKDLEQQGELERASKIKAQVYADELS